MPIEHAIVVKGGGAALSFALKRLCSLSSRNDEALNRERLELALEWGAELKAALPLAIEYLERRVDELDKRVESIFEDIQLSRVFRNFAFEAAREALAERRAMLAHAAAGILDPDLSVERKARVERTLRDLDPADVLSLYGTSLLVSGHDPQRSLGKCLYRLESCDVLVSSGCIRIEALGGGAGQGAYTGAALTRLGRDVLTVLRSYTATRKPPFEVPGREVSPKDRAEHDARRTLDAIADLREFVYWIIRRSSRVNRTYKRDQTDASKSTLTLLVPDWRDWQARLNSMVRSSADAMIRLTLTPQPCSPESGIPDELLRVEFTGPHDLLRYLADDCEAPWMN